MNYWSIVYRFAWVLILALFVIGVTCLFLPKCRGLKTLQQRKLQLSQENRELEEQTRELQGFQEKFRADPAFVERVARESGMVKAHETVFRVSSNTTDNGSMED